MTSDADWGHIPDETPIDDVSGLLVKTITTRRELNQMEAENIALCTVAYLIGRPTAQEAPFDFDWFFSLHREMFGQVWSWAGKPRQSDLNLGCPWHQVETQVLDLTETLPYWSEMPLVEQAARLHHRAVLIHPFLNGNGRWARMLANIWLRRHGRHPTVWPEPQMGEVSEIRGAYIAAIKAADQGDYEPLIELHRQFTAGES